MEMFVATKATAESMWEKSTRPHVNSNFFFFFFFLVFLPLGSSLRARVEAGKSAALSKELGGMHTDDGQSNGS